MSHRFDSKELVCSVPFALLKFKRESELATLGISTASELCAVNPHGTDMTVSAPLGWPSQFHLKPKPICPIVIDLLD